MHQQPSHQDQQETAAVVPPADVLAGCAPIERTFTDADLAEVARSDRRLLAARTGPEACARKRRISHRAARRDARSLRERGEPVHAYACDRCGGWHVGHEPVAHTAARSSAPSAPTLLDVPTSARTAPHQTAPPRDGRGARTRP